MNLMFLIVGWEKVYGVISMVKTMSMSYFTPKLLQTTMFISHQRTIWSDKQKPFCQSYDTNNGTLLKDKKGLIT